MTKRDTKVIKARNTIIGFVSLIVIMILGFGTYVSTGLSGAGPITENEDYVVVQNAAARRSGQAIKVWEFFSYACVHCKNFDPLIEEWAAKQADDVQFSRVPASFSPIQTLLAQTYLTLDALGTLEQNHTRIFRAIHDARRQFLTPEMVADYVDGRGVSRDDFLREFNSLDIRQRMRRTERDQRDFVISATPSLVVAGKYVVGMGGGQKRALEIVDHLIAQERAADGTDTESAD